jgi:hypothetical protein
MSKKKVLFLGSVPMSLDELQMAPAVIGAFVKKRGHEFDYQDINLRLFEYCNKNHSNYLDQTEFLQDKNNLKISNPIIDRWQQSIVNDLTDVDFLLVNVFSTFSHMPALRIINLCRYYFPDIKIIIGGIGSQKKLLGGINEFNINWIQGTFANCEDEIFGQLCINNNFVDDWQTDVGLDVLEKWLPTSPLSRYEKEFDFEHYRINEYRWPNNQRRIPMLGNYGCVRQCSFCDVIKYFPRYSFIEADTLTKSIVQAYNETGISQIQFMDSLVNGSLTNFLQLLKNLSQAREQGWLPEDFSWSGTYICRSRSKLLDEIHQYLKPSGVDNLVIGVETGSDRIRFEMEKKFTNDDLIYELQVFKSRGIKATGLFFPSWPTETIDDFQETLELFEKLSEFGQTGTLESISLGPNGFSLVDGAPIDQDKEKIGLVPGPLPWLWKCDSNPTLTFWETVRRRLLMAEWCEMLGIRLANESNFRQTLAFNLKHHHSTILEYSGNLAESINPVKYLPRVVDHSIRMKVINSGQHRVVMKISIDDNANFYHCDPGITPVSFDFKRNLLSNEKIKFEFEFDQNHCSQWNTYDSGDYYDSNGLYLDEIRVDHSDITYWGWNHIVDLTWTEEKSLPADYQKHQNFRCITSGMELSINLPPHQSLHKYLIIRTDQNASSFLNITNKLYTRLDKFLKHPSATNNNQIP